MLLSVRTSVELAVITGTTTRSCQKCQVKDGLLTYINLLDLTVSSIVRRMKRSVHVNQASVSLFMKMSVSCFFPSIVDVWSYPKSIVFLFECLSLFLMDLLRLVAQLAKCLS